MPPTYTDDPAQAYEDQKLLDALDTKKNLATWKRHRARAREVVNASIAQSNDELRRYTSDWKKWEDLAQLKSLSEEARGLGFHLNTPWREVEKLTQDMMSAVFAPGRELIALDITDETDEKKKAAQAALVEQRLNDEAKLEAVAPEIFRLAGVYGTVIGKVYPRREYVHALDREGRVTRLANGGTRYRVSGIKDVTKVVDRLRLDVVSVWDFRCAPGVEDLDEADWCGDWSYPKMDEVKQLGRAGYYGGPELREALDWVEGRKRRPDGRGMVTSLSGDALSRSGGPRVSNRGPVSRHRPESTPSMPRFRRFEWWGLYPLGEKGEYLPTVITALAPWGTEYDDDYGLHAPTKLWVVRVARNPYFHQRKPYVFYPLIKQHGSIYGRSLMELMANLSAIEDEFYALGMMGRLLEVSPPIEVADSAGVNADDLKGFLPGQVFEVAERGQWGFVQPPIASKAAFDFQAYVSAQQAIQGGNPTPPAQPRVSASATVQVAREADARLALYLHGFEHWFLGPAAEMVHAINRQYVTSEMAIKILGREGLEVRSPVVIRPDELAVDVKARPLIGSRLAQQAVQGQGLLHLAERALVINQASLAAGKGEIVPMDVLYRRILSDVFGIEDADSLVLPPLDEEHILSAAEEHRILAKGMPVSVQRGENVLLHLRAHLRAVEEGIADDWDEVSKELLAQHIEETADYLRRAIEKASPTASALVLAMLEAEFPSLQRVTGGKYTQAAQDLEQMNTVMGSAVGGRGPATPTQSPGSPLIRPPSQSDIRSAAAAGRAGAVIPIQ